MEHTLQNNVFSIFPEYFIGTCIIYMLIVFCIIQYKNCLLIVQKPLSECIAIVLLMACFLTLNDDLEVLMCLLEDMKYIKSLHYIHYLKLHLCGVDKFLCVICFLRIVHMFEHDAFTNLTSIIHMIEIEKLILNYFKFGNDFDLGQINLFYLSNFYNSILNDFLSLSTKFVIMFSASIYFLIIASFLNKQKLTAFEYLFIIFCSVLGLILLCSSNDLLIAYLSMELFSLSFYILAAFKKDSSYSIESGLKYFIIGSVSSAFFLLGSSILYGFGGSINISDFFGFFSQSYFDYETLSTIYHYDLMIDNFSVKTTKGILEISFWFDFLNYFINNNYVEKFIEIGLSLILFSLFIKLALAPFHLWSLDVYEGSSTSTTFFFAVLSKLSIFVLLIRFCVLIFFFNLKIWQFYFIILGILSVFIGSFGGLKQRKLKTLLAYSSVAHMGYVTLSFSIFSSFGIQMAFFYLIIYMIVGLITWFILMLLRLKKKNLIFKYNKELNDLLLLRSSNKYLSFVLALSLFSIAGIPPIIGFISKLNIFISLLTIKKYFLSITCSLLSIISTFYYLRIIKILYFENSIVGNLYYPIKNYNVIILSILNILLILFFLNPTLLYIFIQGFLPAMLSTESHLNLL